MNSKIELHPSVDDPKIAYVSLPRHPGRGQPGVVSKVLRLHEIIQGYQGAAVNLDFDKDGILIGIEILADDDD